MSTCHSTFACKYKRSWLGFGSSNLDGNNRHAYDNYKFTYDYVRESITKNKNNKKIHTSWSPDHQCRLLLQFAKMKVTMWPWSHTCWGCMAAIRIWVYKWVTFYIFRLCYNLTSDIKRSTCCIHKKKKKRFQSYFNFSNTILIICWL